MYIYLLQNRYTLSSSVFRRELCLLISEIIKSVFGVENGLYRLFQQFNVPTTVTTRTMREQAVAVRRQTREIGE